MDHLASLKKFILNAYRYSRLPYFYGKSIVAQHKNGDSYTDNLSVVVVVKNEEDYIREWVEFYRSTGIDRIYLYDNESTDGTKSKIMDYIESGFVVYTFFPGKGQQLKAYNNALKNFGKNSKYMIFVDCDEFLMTCNRGDSLFETIEDIFSKNSRGGVLPSTGGCMVRRGI